MARVKYFCCGCSLRTGTQIIVFSNTIYRTFTFLLSIDILLLDGIREIDTETITLVLFGVFNSFNMAFTYMGLMVSRSGQSIALFFYMVWMMIHLSLDIFLVIRLLLLIVEIIKSHHPETKAFIFISTKYVDGTSGSEPTMAPTVSTPRNLVILEIVLLFGFVVELYYFLVLYSYYKELEEKERDEVREGSAENPQSRAPWIRLYCVPCVY